MNRESFIFYKSFYDSIKELPEEEQFKIYDAIFKYQFCNEENDLSGISKSIFILIKPQLNANNKKFKNGCKGGAPKGNSNAKKQPKNNLKTTKKQPNVNVNENDNVNVNENDTKKTTNIYDYITTNFGIMISGTNYELIKSWLLYYPNDVLLYAVDLCVKNSKRTITYWNGILNNWKGNNYKTLLDIKEETKEQIKKNENGGFQL